MREEDTKDRPAGACPDPESPSDSQSELSAAQALAQDKDFRKFFTTTVIEVPEQMRRVVRPAEETEEEPERRPRRGFGAWLGSLFASHEEDDDGDGPLIPEDGETNAGDEPADAGETGEIPLAVGDGAAPENTGEVPLENTGEIPLGDTGEIPLQNTRIPLGDTGEIPLRDTRLRPEAPVAAASGEAAETVRPQPPEKDFAEPETAEKTKDIPTPPAPEAPAGPEDRAPAPAPQKAAAPRTETARVTVNELLERIDATQAAVAGGCREPQPGALRPAQAAPETIRPAEQPGAEPAETAEETAAQPAEAGAAAPAEVPAEAPAQKSAPLAEPEPEQPDAEPAETAEETAAQPAEKAAAAPAEIPAKTPAEETAETGAAPEPAQTGAAPESEPTGEISLAGMTGEIPLPDAAAREDEVAAKAAAITAAAAAAIPAEDVPLGPGRRRPWNRLVDLFAGSPEEEEPDGDEEAAPEREKTPAPGNDPTQEIPFALGPEGTEYTDPEEAEQLRTALEGRAARLTLRAALTGILAAALILLDLMARGTLPAPSALTPAAAPSAWLGIHLILLAVCAGLNWGILRDGLPALLPGYMPTADALPALAVCAAGLQLVIALLKPSAFDPAAVTVFTGAAALGLFADVLGRRLGAEALRGSFTLMTSGVETKTAYCLRDAAATAALCAGMEEEEPVLLLSRPAGLIRDFLGQSAAPHRSDRLAVDFSRVLGAVALAGAVVALVRGGSLLSGVTVLAAILCLGAPLSAVLVRTVPALLMERSAAQVGAVVPGAPAVEQLGEVDMLQVDASDLFPPACAHLYGIKTIQKERVDRAILYATSILIEGCSTLSGLFRTMIENKTELLYPVKDLEKRTGEGYVAWCDNCRVLLGTRAMMESEGIALPAMDYENRYTQNGDRHLLYLAVSGKLSAMFLFGYSGTKSVARTLGTLRRENIRLLVTADDPTLTAARIEDAYRLRPGFIKVLNAGERDRLAPAVAYLPAAEGCMVHLEGFASMVGGLQAAAGADRAEHTACTIQTVGVTVSVVLGLLLSFTGGLVGIALPAVLLYQLAWSALSVAVTLMKKY